MAAAAEVANVTLSGSKKNTFYGLTVDGNYWQLAELTSSLFNKEWSDGKG